MARARTSLRARRGQPSPPKMATVFASLIKRASFSIPRRQDARPAWREVRQHVFLPAPRMLRRRRESKWTVVAIADGGCDGRVDHGTRLRRIDEPPDIERRSIEKLVRVQLLKRSRIDQLRFDVARKMAMTAAPSFLASISPLNR